LSSLSREFLAGSINFDVLRYKCDAFSPLYLVYTNTNCYNF